MDDAAGLEFGHELAGVRQHSLTKKGPARGGGSHLSACWHQAAEVWYWSPRLTSWHRLICATGHGADVRKPLTTVSGLQGMVGMWCCARAAMISPSPTATVTPSAVVSTKVTTKQSLLPAFTER